MQWGVEGPIVVTQPLLELFLTDGQHACGVIDTRRFLTSEKAEGIERVGAESDDGNTIFARHRLDTPCDPPE